MQHIGLGKAEKIYRIEIDWPSGKAAGDRLRQVVENVPLDSWIVIREGEPGFDLRPRSQFVLGSVEGAASGHQH